MAYTMIVAMTGTMHRLFNFAILTSPPRVTEALVEYTLTIGRTVVATTLRQNSRVHNLIAISTLETSITVASIVDTHTTVATTNTIVRGSVTILKLASKFSTQQKILFQTFLSNFWSNRKITVLASKTRGTETLAIRTHTVTQAERITFNFDFTTTTNVTRLTETLIESANTFVVTSKWTSVLGLDGTFRTTPTIYTKTLSQMTHTLAITIAGTSLIETRHNQFLAGRTMIERIASTSTTNTNTVTSTRRCTRANFIFRTVRTFETR